MSDPMRAAQEAYQRGNLDLTARLCQEIVRSQPESVAAWQLLALSAAHQGANAQAAEYVQHVLRLESHHAEYWMQATEIFRRVKRYTEAVAAGRRAVALSPDQPAAWNNLGLALQDSGQVVEAEQPLRQALTLAPGYARAHRNLGNVLLQLNRLDEALSCLHEALRLQPQHAPTLNSLGQVFQKQGQTQQAVAALRHALALQPNYAPALLNLGNALSEMDQNADAEQCLRRAIEVSPNYTRAYHDLGAFLEKRGRMTEASAAYEQTLRIEPDFYQTLAALENVRRRVCAWADWPARMGRLLTIVRDCLARGEPSPLWPLASCRFPTTSADRLAIARHHARQLRQQVDARQVPLHRVVAPPDKPRLRLGFLAHELGNHVAGHLLQGLFGRFDRSRFEVWAFDYSPDETGPIRRRIRADCDQFIDVGTLDDRRAAQRIAAAEIDILLDINSYMMRGRPAIAAWRPAPIQVSYMYPASTGADWIDYFLTDAQVTPPGDEEFFSEKLVYLPDTYLPTNGDQEIAEVPADRSAWGLPVEGFVFASFNSADKIEPRLFDIWMRLLQVLPESVLWQRGDDAETQANLRREAAAHGVDPQRIVFAPACSPMERHLARQRCADLFLDTLTHGGHGTAVDALCAGVPWLTCVGDTFTGRVAASLLTAAGVPELIAANETEYERRALDLAHHPEMLRELREKIAAQRRSCPLFDTTRLVRHLEQAFTQMWQLYASGQGPEAIWVRADG